MTQLPAPFILLVKRFGFQKTLSTRQKYPPEICKLMFSDLKKDNWKLSDFITYGHQAKTTKCQYLKTGSEFINLDKDSPAYSTNERDLCSLQNEIIDLELKS